MKKLNLKIVLNNSLESICKVNGKNLNYKKNKFGCVETVIENDNEYSEIVIYNFREINCKFWFILEILFYIVSIFGIFDVKRDKKARSLSVRIKVRMEEDNNLKIVFNQFKDGGEAIRIDGDSTYEILDNRYYIDEEALKKFKILKIAKIFAFIIILVIAILLIL